MILYYGGSRDEWTSLTAFLGRDPDIQAYLRYLKAVPGKGKDDLKRIDEFCKSCILEWVIYRGLLFLNRLLLH